jgi:hypothetical protein
MKVFALTPIFLFNILFGFSQTTDSSKSQKRIVPWFVERFKISAGFFYVVNITSVQVSITGTPGTDIDYQKDLGYNKEVGTFLTSFQWRISSRSRFSFSYYNIKRSSTHRLTKDITFQDNTYYINEEVNTFFNTSIYQFSYGYALISKPKIELGLLIGAHVVGSKAGIALSDANPGISGSNNFGFTAPLPNLGIWGGYALSNRFSLNFDLDYFALTIKSITGRVLASNFSLTYRLINKLDISLGYTGLNFKVDIVKGNADGRFKWGYNGPAIAATFSFGKNSWRHL